MDTLTTIVPASVSLLFLTISTILSWLEYKKSENIDLRNMVVGWVLVSQFTLSYVVFHIFRREELTELRRIVTYISLTLNMCGFLLLWYYFHHLNNRTYSIRHYAMVAYSFFSYGMLIPAYQLTWVANHWENTWNPEWALFFPMFALTWITSEIIMILIFNFRSSSHISSPYDYLIVTGWTFILISPIIVVVERLFFQSNDTVFYMFEIAIGAFMITLGIYRKPIFLHISPIEFLNNSIGRVATIPVSPSHNFYEKTVPLLKHFKEAQDYNSILMTLIFVTKFNLSHLEIIKAQGHIGEIEELIEDHPHLYVAKVQRDIKELKTHLDNLIFDVKSLQNTSMREILSSTPIKDNKLYQKANNAVFLKRIKISDFFILNNVINGGYQDISYTDAIKGIDFVSRSSIYKRIKLLIELKLLDETAGSLDDLTKKEITITDLGVKFMDDLRQLIITEE